jgi:hypothetical protein
LEAWIPTIAVSVQFLVIAAVVAGWRWARTKARQVEAETAAAGLSSYSQTGGARLDTFNATIPFATLVVAPDAITLSVIGRQYRFEKSQVLSLAKYRGFLSSGLKIEHKASSTPPHVVFWTTNFEKLASALERLGWPISG